jgi:hypothetical protein
MMNGVSTVPKHPSSATISAGMVNSAERYHEYTTGSVIQGFYFVVDAIEEFKTPAPLSFWFVPLSSYGLQTVIK